MRLKPSIHTVLSLIFVCLGLCPIGACQPAGTSAPTNMAAAELEQAANELAEDINLLYTINRLELKPQQIETLSVLAGQAQEAMAKLQPARQSALASLIPLLREKRHLLMRDKDIPAQLEKALQEAQTKIEEAEEKIKNAPLAFVPELRKILSPAQIAILTGMDEARAQAEELLEWVRRLSAAAFAEEAPPTAEELADPQAKLTAKDIMQIFTEVRKLPAAEYTKKKETYIARIAVLYAPTQEAADGFLAEFLAAPRLAALLQERASLQPK